MVKQIFIYIIGGCIASGKTFISKILFPYLDYISPDQFMSQGKWTKEKSDKAWVKTHLKIIEKIKQGKSFVIDTAFARPWCRKELTDIIHNNSKGNYKIIFIYIKSSLEDCLKRNNQRKDHKEPEDQVKKYFNIIKRNPYSIKDGYNHIIIVNN